MAVLSNLAPTGLASGHARFNRLLFVLALLPMVLIAAIINHYGVNVPYGDEWSVVTLLGKWDSHQLTFADFYGAHNGHRILIPRLIYLGLTQVSPGNLRAEMFLSLVLCIFTSAGIYLLLRRTVSGSTTRHLALWALVNLFLFSPIQGENWLWGFQLQVFLSNLCIVGALVCLTSEAKLLVRFVGALVFALAGTFSFGNGLLIWPAVFVVLVCRRENISVKAAWIIIAVLVMFAYLPGYPAREPTPATTQWFDYLLYFAGFLGAPLARIPNSKPLILPVMVGSALALGYVWLAGRSVRDREVRQRALPWLVLGGYVIASAVMASVARIHSGPAHALDSRYTTVSLVLIVSLVGLGASLLTQDAELKTTRLGKRSVLGGMAIGGLLILYAVNVPFELRYLHLNHRFRSLGKAALEFSAVLDLDQMCRAVLLIRQEPATLVRSLGVLDRLKLLVPPRRQTAVLDDGEGRPKRTTDEYGMFESVTFESADTLVASGWSYLPGDASAPACVLFAYRNGQDWKAFTLSEVTERRPDLTTRHGRQSYLETGWRHTFSRTLLPPGEQEISAWAMEPSHGQTYRLPGSFKLQR
jgi:hypothetical protein